MSWLRDPVFLFLALGGLLALAHLALREDEPVLRRDTDIVVTDADVLWLAQAFQKTWQRPPTRIELHNLVDRRVRDEILYREARALGLDQGDDALRRRLATKLEFLAKDAGAATAPTDAELRAYLEKNGADYALPRRRSFEQIYLNVDRRGAAAGADAAKLLERLRADPELDTSTLGDRIMLEAKVERATLRDVEALFGAAFAQTLFEQPVGRWAGPLRSGYGLHLVRVGAEEPGRAPLLEEVHERVRLDLIDRRREEALEVYVEALRQRYDVTLQAASLAEDGE